MPQLLFGQPPHGPYLQTTELVFILILNMVYMKLNMEIIIIATKLKDAFESKTAIALFDAIKTFTGK